MPLAKREAMDPAPSAGPQPPVFERILCGVDGSRADDEAVRQASILLAPDGALTLIAARNRGVVPSGTRSETPVKRLGDALDRGLRIASEHGVTASVEFGVEGPTDEQLIRRSRGYGLLVVGCDRHPWSVGVAARTLASALIHRAPVPVMVARTPPPGTQFPQRVVVASDGSTEASRAVDLSLRLCAEHQATIALVLAARNRDLEPQTLTVLNPELFEQLAVDRLLIDPDTAPHTTIVEWAKLTNASLVVVGSRRPSASRAIASVSEHVAHQAPCSVLVARHEPVPSKQADRRNQGIEATWLREIAGWSATRRNL
jgi:nucleotide-binding universal stress UspA family protein